MTAIRTPCIGICSTTSFGDKICRGCKRFNFEVINWNSYTEQEKVAVMSRIEQFTEQIMKNKFHIFAPGKLEQVLCDFRIFYDSDLSPYCWLHTLLQKHFHRIRSLEEVGVSLTTPYAGKDVRDVLLEVNEDLFTLAEAHFERYFR